MSIGTCTPVIAFAYARPCFPLVTRVPGQTSFAVPILIINEYAVPVLAGALPATLPSNFSLSSSNKNVISLNVLWLSNNSFTGSLPDLWGDSASGWGPFMQRMFLNGNQLTGSLPELWSSSQSLANLGKLDLSNNALSGSIPWTTRNLPALLNFIVLPGTCTTYVNPSCLCLQIQLVKQHIVGMAMPSVSSIITSPHSPSATVLGCAVER